MLTWQDIAPSATAVCRGTLLKRGLPSGKPAWGASTFTRSRSDPKRQKNACDAVVKYMIRRYSEHIRTYYAMEYVKANLDQDRQNLNGSTVVRKVCQDNPRKKNGQGSTMLAHKQTKKKANQIY